MITVRYFASLREAVGQDIEYFNYGEDVQTVRAVLDFCRAQSKQHAEALSITKVLRAALNQTLTSLEAQVADGDEIAFFPPVTGG
jgi:molybdopterin synthase sulfur carrier subunit